MCGRAVPLSHQFSNKGPGVVWGKGGISQKPQLLQQDSHLQPISDSFFDVTKAIRGNMTQPCIDDGRFHRR